MIISMRTRSRPQQRYDHRLRDLVRRTGDLTIPTDLVSHGRPLDPPRHRVADRYAPIKTAFVGRLLLPRKRSAAVEAG
jgi:hypothetical protein